MRAILCYLILFFLGVTNLTQAQAPFYTNMKEGSYFGGKFTIKKKTHSGHNFILSDFNREGYSINRDSNAVKAKFFAQNAYNQYEKWKIGKEILLVTNGAFITSHSPSGVPVGLCVDNGTIVTRDVDSTMDGLVIFYNGGTQVGGIAVIDMDINPVKANGASYYLRKSSADRVNFLNWGQQNGLTCFQTQLVYSIDRPVNFANMNYGQKRQRRFLTICKTKPGGIIHHVIVDAPNPLELNVSASHAKSVLESEGFTVSYILNLDSGAENILWAYNGASLYDYQPGKDYGFDAKIENARILLVYYK